VAVHHLDPAFGGSLGRANPRKHGERPDRRSGPKWRSERPDRRSGPNWRTAFNETALSIAFHGFTSLISLEAPVTISFEQVFSIGGDHAAGDPNFFSPRGPRASNF
jgi:hypothetical protein